MKYLKLNGITIAELTHIKTDIKRSISYNQHISKREPEDLIRKAMTQHVILSGICRLRSGPLLSNKYPATARRALDKVN